MNGRVILALAVALLVILGGTLTAISALPHAPSAVTVNQWAAIDATHALLLSDDTEEATYLPILLR